MTYYQTHLKVFDVVELKMLLTSKKGTTLKLMKKSQYLVNILVGILCHLLTKQYSIPITIFQSSRRKRFL